MKFSIIIPVFNAERHLNAALDSVVSQTFADWECVCVDDGSTDSTAAILDDYAVRDTRFLVIHQCNGGEGAARNAGLGRARGDWILYLDADDVLNPQLLRSIADSLNDSEGMDLVAYGCQQFAQEAAPTWKPAKGFYFVDQSITFSPNLLSRGVCQCAYRRELIDGIVFSRLKIGADLVYVSECMARVNHAIVLDVEGYGYRICSESMSHRERSPQMMMDTIDFRRIVFRNWFASGKKFPREYARAPLNQWIEGAPYLLRSRPYAGEWKPVWDYWYESLAEAARNPYLTLWQKSVVAVVSRTRLQILVFILCIFPCWLKNKGIHR